MFFNLSVAKIAVFVGLIWMTSCSLPTNEEPAKTAPPEAKIGFESKCLKNTLPVLKRFLNAEAKPAEIESVWNCFGGAVDLFYRKVRGRTENEYSPRELAKFLEEYFLDNTKIEDPLLEQLMKVKQVLVGGRAETLTKEELKKLVSFIQEARDISLILLPYMKLYLLQWERTTPANVQVDSQLFTRASEALNSAAEKLGRRIESNGQEYSLKDFAQFLLALEAHYGQSWDFVRQVNKGIPLVEKMKKTLVGGSESTVTGPEWKRFVILGARGYTQYLRYKYFLAEADTKLSEERVNNLATMADELLSLFGDMVREKPSHMLTADELIEISEAVKSIIPQFRSSQGLIRELMKIKKVVVGGSENNFLPADFDRSHPKISVIRLLINQSMPHFSVYNGDFHPESLDMTVAQATFEKADVNLNDVAVRISALIEGGYDLQDLSSLVQELESTFEKPGTKLNWSKNFERFYPLLISIKQMVLHDQGSIVHKSDWPSILNRGSRLYSRYLYYNYFLAKKSLTDGMGLESLPIFVNSIVDVVDGLLIERQLLEKRSVSVIQASEWRRVVDALEKAELLPSQFNAALIKPVLNVLFNKILQSPAKRLSGFEPNGLTRDGLQVIKLEFGLWVEGQRLSQKLFNRIPAPSGFSEEQIIQYIKSNGQTKTAWNEMSLNIDAPSRLPLVFDSEGRLVLSSSRTRLYNKKSIEKLNLARSLVRVIIRSYAQSSERIRLNQGLNLTEAKTLLADFRNLAIELGLLEPENLTFIESRFREGNLFSAHADGDDLLSFKEGVDLILMIFSGLELDKAMKEQFHQDCRISNQVPSGDERINIRCFIRTYRREFASIFTSTPDFSRYFMSLDSGVQAGGVGPIPEEEMLSFDVMLVNLLKSTGWIDDGSGFVKIKDTALVPHLIQYIETVMIRFDSGRNGILEREEALNAFPLFREILKTVAKNDSDRILKGAFAYILVYGHAPETAAEKTQFILSWVRQESSWPIMADRKKLADVLGYIADQLAKPAQSSKKKKADRPEENGSGYRPEGNTSYTL